MSTSHTPSRPGMSPMRKAPRALRLGIVAVASVLALSVVLNVSASTTSMTVPGVAAPGARITVSGTGFAGGQAGNLTFNGAIVTTFKADTAGAFSVPFTIPAKAALNTLGRISAKTASGTVLATSTLAIATGLSGPTLFVPSSASPGSRIRVGGAGFHAGQTGNLTYDGGVVTTFTAASNGSFEVIFAVPANADLGTGRISAKTSAGTLIATTTLTVSASAAASVAPSSTATPTANSTVTAVPTASPAAVSTPDPTAIVTVSASPKASASASPSATPLPPVTTSTSGPLPSFSHVYVIVFENKEYSSIVGSSSAPYINSLIAKYGLSTSFYAERHPSEPNYIALTSGGTQGITDDGVYNLGVNNLFSQVSASGRTWRSVQQGYPGHCFTGSSSSAVVDGVGKSGSYVRKHNPAISYTAVSGNAAACANITNLASFDPAAASFEFITPNMINDMHDGTIADGDNFLKAFLPKITTSAAFANSVVFVTFDEGSTNVNGGGHIFTMAITPKMTPGFKQAAAYNHYSMLRTIEQAWGLPTLGSASSAATMAFPW